MTKKIKQTKIGCSALVLLIAVGQLKSGIAQQPPPRQPDQDEVIRVKTDLVQVRAVVTDKKGTAG